MDKLAARGREFVHRTNQRAHVVRWAGDAKRNQSIARLRFSISSICDACHSSLILLPWLRDPASLTQTDIHFLAGIKLGLVEMVSGSSKRSFRRFLCRRFPHSANGAGLCCLLLAAILPGLFSSHACAQQTGAATPVVVQPGAPGKPSKTLPPSTKGELPPTSRADVEFMQGMIMHHEQAVEMTALIQSHTANKDLRLLGARISSSQSDEIRFMQRWLAARGEPLSMPMPATPAMDMPGMDMQHHPMALMPGMLTPEQMEALRKAKGSTFDHLFLTGMIQHHNGALTMVHDLFNTAGAGQDADIFNFATDADNTQRAEIRIMQSMLEKKLD